jgi:hypothetical protein
LRPQGDASDPILDPIHEFNGFGLVEPIEILQLDGARLRISAKKFDPAGVQFGVLKEWKDSDTLHPYALSDQKYAKMQIKDFVCRNVWTYVNEKVRETDLLTRKIFTEAHAYIVAKKVCILVQRIFQSIFDITTARIAFSRQRLTSVDSSSNYRGRMVFRGRCQRSGSPAEIRSKISSIDTSLSHRSPVFWNHVATHSPTSTENCAFSSSPTHTRSNQS